MRHPVAPYVGAWIEIWSVNWDLPESLSLPTWERGLKSRANVDIADPSGRSLRGSVD